MKAYSVRLKIFKRTRAGSYYAEAFDGSRALIPASDVFGMDYSTQKSDAAWISASFLEGSKLQYSRKKSVNFGRKDGRAYIIPEVTIERRIPKNIPPSHNNPDADLIR